MRLGPLWLAFLDVLFPPRCVVAGCGAWGGWLCPVCLAGIKALPAIRCPCCGDATARAGRCEDCWRDPPPFRRAVAAGVYTTPLRDAIHSLKFRGVAQVASPLGALAAAAFRADRDDLGGSTGFPGGGRATPSRAGRPDGAACVVLPVPSHPRRTAGRGVDPTRCLAMAVARALGLPLAPDLLIRARDTRPQVGLAPGARRRNVAGAFAVAESRLASLGTTRGIILVDDVMTTGATARACALALTEAGLHEIDVCTVARAISAARPTGQGGMG